MAGQRAGRVPRGSAARRPLRAAPDPDAIRQAYRGRKRDALLLDLAMAALSYDELAAREGVDSADLEAFARDFETEVIAIREALVDNTQLDTAGLWIASKRARLAEYQAEIDDIDDTLAEYRAADLPWGRSHRDMLRIKMDLYRQAADELGAYPQRQAAPARQGAAVHYVIEAADEEAMS